MSKPTGLFSWAQILEAAGKANVSFGFWMPQGWIDCLNGALRELPSAPETPPTGAPEIDELISGLIIAAENVVLDGDKLTAIQHRNLRRDNLLAAIESLRAQNQKLEAAAAKGTEYVLAQINADLRIALSASEARAAAAEKERDAANAKCSRLKELYDDEDLADQEIQSLLLEVEELNVTIVHGDNRITELSAEVARLTAELAATKGGPVSCAEHGWVGDDSCVYCERDTARQDCEARDRVLRELVECDEKRKAARDSVAVVADAHAAETTYESIIARARQLLKEGKE